MKKRYDPRRTSIGETPRQQIIGLALTYMRRGYSASEALEASTDGAQPGTWGAEMRRYYRTVSERGLDRLIATLNRMYSEEAL